MTLLKQEVKKIMKKLMIAAAAAAMIGGAYADACRETAAGCMAWNVTMTLKTLKAAKTVKCAAEDPCDESVTKVYYMDNATRKIKGLLWSCEYVCGGGMNVALWDPDHKLAIWYADYDAPISFDQVKVYGKKATKVAGSLTFENENIVVTAAGVNGKFVRTGDTDDCYVKSLSGYVAGSLAWIAPSAEYEVVDSGSLCDEPIICDEDTTPVKLLDYCDACCFEGWCDADDAEDLVPAVGTWSMKYKEGYAAKSLSALVPAYAL